MFNPFAKLTARALLATAAVILFGGVVALLIFFSIPEVSENALLILLGILARTFGDVYAYYFGSSEGSSKKQDTLDRLMNK